MQTKTVTRRKFLKRAALATTAAIAAPYMRTSYSAGRLALGCWDHWVPGANDTLTKICNEWGEQNHVEVHIDYITSVGDKDLLTASAEAQAKTGHDIMQHRAWQVAVHREVLEPTDDVSKRKPELVDSWTWDNYLIAAEKLFKAGYPVGLPMGQTSDAIDWVGALFRAYGSVFVDSKDAIKVNSPETRAALEMAQKIMAVNPPDVYAWDDAGNNRWLISGKGSNIMNPPSAWSVAVRDNLKVGEQCWTHDMPKGPKGRFAPNLPFFYGVWNFGANKTAAKELIHHIVDKPQARRLVAASNGYDLPSFKSYYDFDTWEKVGPPVGTVYNYPPRGDEQYSLTGYPARPDVASQIYNQSIHTIMVAKVSQGKEKVDDVIKWAEKELEGYLRS